MHVLTLIHILIIIPSRIRPGQLAKSVIGPRDAFSAFRSSTSKTFSIGPSPRALGFRGADCMHGTWRLICLQGTDWTPDVGTRVGTLVVILLRFYALQGDKILCSCSVKIVCIVTDSSPIKHTFTQCKVLVREGCYQR